MDTDESLVDSSRNRRVKQVNFAFLMGRKVNKRFLEELERNYPDYNFEIMGIHEKPQSHIRDVDPFRVRIYTDPELVVVRIPMNG